LYPKANLVAIFAIGYPVALDANAEEGDTRGLISLLRYLLFRQAKRQTARYNLLQVSDATSSKLHNHAFFEMSYSRESSLALLLWNLQYEFP
jgi:hypothetical protein